MVLFLLLRALFSASVPVPVCMAVAMLYTLHPIHTASVDYLVGRAQLLGMLFTWMAPPGLRSRAYRGRGLAGRHGRDAPLRGARALLRRVDAGRAGAHAGAGFPEHGHIRHAPELGRLRDLVGCVRSGCSTPASSACSRRATRSWRSPRWARRFSGHSSRMSPALFPCTRSSTFP